LTLEGEVLGNVTPGRGQLLIVQELGGRRVDDEPHSGPAVGDDSGPYARMKPGFVINYWAVRSAKWTDTKRTPPAGPPFR
jgi:hypothetical protein